MKRLLLIVCAFLFLQDAKATHLMGGDITAKLDSAGNYTIQLTHYRDTLGIPLDPTVTLKLYLENSGSWVIWTTAVVPLNVAASTALIPSFPYGIEVGVYTMSMALPPGKVRITNDVCCRNNAIVNMFDPGAESLVLYTDVLVDTPSGNSTPDFLAMPVAYFPQNQPATYNPLPFDPDGDSLSWNLNVPMGNTNGLTTVPVLLFTPPSSDPSGPFAINPVTGEITWTPDMLGNFVQSFEVIEYKNGLPVGKIIRDMQYVIVPDTGNSSPFFQMVTPYSTNTSQSYYYAYYNSGSPFNFQIQGADNDPNDPLEMEAFSQAFSMANPAMFTTANTAGTITGSFNWTPPASFTQDVIVVFRIGDGQFAKDFTLLLKKNPNPNAVNTIATAVSELKVFPNPASDVIN
ncbi:MAG: hypothetical protein EOP49_30450, partial [Sphingobacteriales bacterium]